MILSNEYHTTMDKPTPGLAVKSLVTRVTSELPIS